MVNVAAQLARNQRDVCKYVADIYDTRAGRLAVDPESPLDIRCMAHSGFRRSGTFPGLPTVMQRVEFAF